MNVIQELTLPASRLRVRPGHNPRTRFDPVALKRLADLIQARGGIVQSLIIRETADNPGFEIVAGERRWRAAQTIENDFPVPCRLVIADDKEALAIALTENDGREDLSPTEEAVSAKTYLDMCKGNRDEAAAYLGWSPAKLNHRLALLQCTEAVREGLTNKTILLGHAELLARLAPKNQDIALKRIIEHRMSVADVKSKLADLSQKIATAIFDTTGCQGCRHNTSEQTGLFAESIDEGYCTNPPCFTEKTDCALEENRQRLLQEVPKVEFIEAHTTVFPIKLVADGPTGIGEGEVRACRSCANFGSTISKLPASLGAIEEAMCFDASCNSRKVAKRIKDQDSSAAEPEHVATGSDSPTIKKASSKQPTAVVTPQRVNDYRISQWRKITANIIAADFALAQKVLLAIGLAGHARCISQTKFGDLFKKIVGHGVAGTTMTHVLQRVEAADADEYPRLIAVMAATAIGDLDKEVLVQLMRYLKVDIGTYWRLDVAFCELLTKSELEAVAEEIGLKTAIGQSFSKIMSGKKADIIKQLLDVKGFEFQGKVPTVMRYVGAQALK